MYYSYSDPVEALGGMVIGYTVILILIAVFSIICLWRIFVKAGHGGWKVLIPVYNAITFYNICWKFIYFLIPIGICALGGIMVGIGAASGSYQTAGAMATIGIVLFVGAGIAFAVLEIIAMVNLARRFGKSGGFAVGLIFLTPVFLAILAFDKSRYLNNGYNEMPADTYTNPYGDGSGASDEW